MTDIFYVLFNGETYADGSSFGHTVPTIYRGEREAKAARGALKGACGKKFSWVMKRLKHEHTQDELLRMVEDYDIVRVRLVTA